MLLPGCYTRNNVMASCCLSACMFSPHPDKHIKHPVFVNLRVCVVTDFNLGRLSNWMGRNRNLTVISFCVRLVWVFVRSASPCWCSFSQMRGRVFLCVTKAQLSKTNHASRGEPTVLTRYCSLLGIKTCIQKLVSMIVLHLSNMT